MGSYLLPRPLFCRLPVFISRNNHTVSKQNENHHTMLAWQINKYRDNTELKMVKKQMPTIAQPSQVLIKLLGTSINVLDVRMRNGYGASLMRPARWKMTGSVNDLPLVLGRDCSGIVVDVGKCVNHIKKGDEVWGAVSALKQGTHAQYVLADMSEIGLKPKNLSHIEAASIPYVAITTWSALCTMAGLCPENTRGKRVLVHAGSGGVGSFAIQLLRAWEADVTTTCSTDAVQLVTGLGANRVVDYRTQNAKRELRQIGKFDIILDPVGGETEKYSIGLLKVGDGKYVSLRSPIFTETDSKGLLRGGLSAGWQMLQQHTKALRSGNRFYWAFSVPNKQALEHVKMLVETNQVQPVIDKVFTFSELSSAVAYVENGGARGKTVIHVNEDSDKVDN